MTTSMMPSEAGPLSMLPGQAVKRQTVLVVTPDAQIRQNCRTLLTSVGMVMEVTESGVTALNLARSLLPDLILLDVELRDVDGMDLVTWLKSDPILRPIPIIAFSAFAGTKQSSRLGNGVRVVLGKPVRAKELESWVRTAL